MIRAVRHARFRALTATAVAAIAASLAYLPLSEATAASPDLAHGARTSSDSGLLAAAKNSPAKPRVLGGNTNGAEPGLSNGLPKGVPSKGSYSFLLKLDAKPTMAAFNSAGTASSGEQQAKAQLAAVASAQRAVVAALPAKTSVLYKTHAVMAGVAVSTDVGNYQALRSLPGVTAVYPIAPKSPSNSYAVPLQKAPQAWEAYGDLGENSTVAVIDTGVDYTHANMGGVGTVAEYDASKARLGQPESPDEFPGPKVIGGFDLAGDDYNADPNSPDFNPVPAPDAYPLDCNGHGSHVAGTVAGYGENADGSTYTGDYDTTTPFDTMRIGPGVAPRAKLYAFRVFGCEGSTDLVSAAIDKAVDPNGDGDPSDHVDVVNMSLGSDYGSPQDGDSVMTNQAAALGIVMALSAGNAGDLYDSAGSPGNAVRALTAAASTDNSAVVDALTVASPPAIAGDYAAERSVAYDWVSDPDLAGTVARVTQPTNLDGCQALNATDTAAVAGKIAFVEWTDTDANRRCGSAARAANLVTAGATGFIYADDSESFAAGITGSAVIPGVLVAKSGGDAIRAQLVASTPVTISGTTANGFTQLSTGRDDLVAGFSSRGMGDVGNVKPDVAAVGESVFSTGVGTGDQGLNDSGTSMASPMVAGTAALVHSQHTGWTPEQVKADIMNTATEDLFTGLNHTGTKYAPERVGAGRIDIKAALDNEVLAYNTDDDGAVSVSFGPQAVAAPTTLHKTITVQNTGASSVTYAVAFANRTTIPGATYSVSPSSVTVGAGASQTVTVTLTIDPKKLTKTIDATVDRSQAGVPRVYQADASGLVVLTSSGKPTLNVPLYAAPRPASNMTQSSSFTLPEGAHQTGLMTLSGTGVSQGSGSTEVDSLVAGFELAATSPAIPGCASGQSSGCIGFPDEGSADIRRVGVTSDAAQVSSLGGNPADDGMTYFAVQANHAWRTPAGIQEFDIYIDTNRDGDPDFVMFNTRLTDTDVLVAETIDLASGDVVDVEPLNAALGDTDTALLESSVVVMPVFNAALGIDPANSRFNYGVLGFTAYQSAPLDTVGVGSGDSLDLSFDPVHPGAAVYGAVSQSTSPLLFLDNPTSVLRVDRDAAAYAADKGQGLMMVHFHNQEAAKVQAVSLTTAPPPPTKVTPTVALSLDKAKVKRGHKVKATITVTGSAGTATGLVELGKVVGGAFRPVASGTLSNGTVTIKFEPNKPGKYVLQAHYDGDAAYNSASSAEVKLKVTKK
jgi:subtilisin family serine protease